MPARIDCMLVAGLVAWLPCGVCAQAPQSPPRWPTAQDLERAQKAHPFPALKELSSPTPIPRIDSTRGNVDIEALMAGKLSFPASASQQRLGAAAFRVFITLEMPRASLELLTDQASRAGAVLVLRGLKSQSMRQTLAVVGDLIGDRSVAWVIDPEAFIRFGVTKAPTFVLSLNERSQNDPRQGCAAGCATLDTFASVSGDVSLDYALEAIVRRRPETASQAEPMIRRLRNSK